MHFNYTTSGRAHSDPDRRGTSALFILIQQRNENEKKKEEEEGYIDFLPLYC